MNTLSGKIDLPELKSIKDTAKSNLKESLGFPKGLSYIGLVAIKDEATRDFVLEGLSAIGLGNVCLGEIDTTTRRYAGSRAEINQNELYAFDFFVHDGELDGLDVVKCMKSGVVPVMPANNIFAGMLTDFNPMKFEGNGFFFKSNNPYCIFEKVVSYLENVKFPEDRRILLKHVSETF
ncbi:MAG: hypothetical protein ACOYN2_01880 [Patescibacteria group bacterium]